MSADMPSMEDTYYLKGNRKVWFWISAGLQVIVFFLPKVLIFIYGLIMGRFNTLLELMNTPYNFLAGISELITAAAWLLILLAYGLNNRIKIFKIMFLFMAATQFFPAIQAVTSLGPTHFQGGVMPVVGIMAAVVHFSRQAVWILFMVIVLAHSKSGRPLKTSAIIVIVFQVLSFVFGGKLLYQILPLYMSSSAVSLIIGLIFIAMSLFVTASMIYFFRTMACTRMKENPKSAVQQTA